MRIWPPLGSTQGASANRKAEALGGAIPSEHDDETNVSGKRIEEPL
jgi:hypothetical protein